MLIADLLGYFVPKSFKNLSDKGDYFISRYKADTNIYDRAANKLDLLKLLQKESFWQDVERRHYYQLKLFVISLGKNSLKGEEEKQTLLLNHWVINLLKGISIYLIGLYLY